jgi:YidC/Oxa1 family membrane protein insertase
MSQAQRPKGSFIQTLLLAATLYLGFSLIFGGLNKPTDTRSADQIYAELVQLNGQIKDVTAARLLPVYERKVRDEAREKGLGERQINDKILAAKILVANAQYRSSIVHPEHAMGKLNRAYLTLYEAHKQFAGTDAWKRPVELGQPSLPQNRERFPETSKTPAEVYDAIVASYSDRLERDLILGFIPGYQMIDALVALTGRVPAFSYAFAALLLAIFVRAIIWPLAQRQLMWGRKMTQLQPLVKELQETYSAKDPTGNYRTSPEFQQKTMELYREYGISPFAGCLPALAQMPLFLLIYQCMVHYRFEFKNGTFLWINPEAGAATGGFVARSLGDMDYILLVIYGISMIVTTFLTPVSDPSNAKQQRLIGVGIALIFTVMMFFWPLPSAFVLYWIFTNILSSFQSLRAYRLPLEPLVKVNSAVGGVIPVNGAINGHVSNKMFDSTGAPRIQKPKKKKRK